MRFRILILIFLLPVHILFSQDQITVDSLELKLTGIQEDSTKIKNLIDISNIYSKFNMIKALQYAESAVELSKSINNTYYLAYSYNTLGNQLTALGNYDIAVEKLLKGLSLAQQNSYPDIEYMALNSLGILQDRLQKYDEALNYYFQALKIYNSLEEKGLNSRSKKNLHILYNNIGNIYLTKMDYESAESYYIKGLEYAESIGDFVNIGVTCNNLGKLETFKKNRTKAYEYLNKSLEARKKINDKHGIAKSYYFISNYYLENKEWDKALYYAKLSFDLGKELKDQLTIRTSTFFLYEINKALGNYKESLAFFEKYKNVSDSLINDTKIQEITRLQLRYEYDKLEKEKEIKQQRIKYTYIITLSVSLLGIIILGLMFFLARSRNHRIQLEKEKLEKDMLIKNKELTTNVMYLLKKNELIEEISKRLLNLKSKLKEENKETIQKIIFDLQAITDKEVWEEFEYRFQSVHEDFYKNLKARFPDLTPSEIKLAAFLRLNMTSKDIASITGQSVNSLEVARSRLRKKFGITNQEVNLVNFLLDL